MSRLGKFVVIVSVIYFFASTVFFSHRTSITQILTLPLFLCFLVALIVGIVCIFTNWRGYKWKSLLPLGACTLSVLISNIATTWIRHAIFVACLPSYEAVIRQMESGAIPVSTDSKQFPQAVPQARLAYSVCAQKDTNGVLTAVFLTESGFPVKHSGYLYSSSGARPGSSANSRWPIWDEERTNWFYVSD